MQRRMLTEHHFGNSRFKTEIRFRVLFLIVQWRSTGESKHTGCPSGDSSLFPVLYRAAQAPFLPCATLCCPVPAATSSALLPTWLLPQFCPISSFLWELSALHLCGARDHCSHVPRASGSAAPPEPLGLKQKTFRWPFVPTFELAGVESSWASLSWRRSAVLRSVWKETSRKFVFCNKYCTYIYRVVLRQNNVMYRDNTSLVSTEIHLGKQSEGVCVCTHVDTLNTYNEVFKYSAESFKSWRKTLWLFMGTGGVL